jgi:acetylornithine deacetylase
MEINLLDEDVKIISKEKQELIKKSIDLLCKLIAIPSFSKHEENTADMIADFFRHNGVEHKRNGNNIWALNKYFNPKLPTLLLNSHHDTVKPCFGWSIDPFTPLVENGKIYGLGSNDAGGALVSLIATFLNFYSSRELKYNIIIATTAEEEISGKNGIELIFPEIGKIDFAIIGEPTQMNLAIAEKGLLVLDCVSKGVSGHAAREEGDNAIYKALKDIEWFQGYKFNKESEYLGPVKMSVTVIKAGSQHNVVPDKCEFTVDVRITDSYHHEELLEIIKQNVSCEVNPRSMRLKSSFISKEHPFVKAGISLGRTIYGSPTTSDQALIDAPSLKIGPGDSARSHSADEFIRIEEIEQGIDLYIKMLEKVIL